MTAAKLQEASYAASVANTVHAVPLATITSRRSTIILGSSDNGNAANQITGVADSGGHTWQKKGSLNGNGCAGECWYAYNLGSAQNVTVYVTYANPVIAAITIQEYSGLLWASDPGDKFVSATQASSTGHSSGSSGTKGSAHELVVGIGAWISSATVTAGSGFGNLIQAKDATSGVSCAMESLTHQPMSGRIANMTTSAASAFVMLGATFYSDGITMTTDENGDLYKNLGVVVEDNGEIGVFESSAGAPNDADPVSGESQGYLFIPQTTHPLGARPTGVKIWFNHFDAYDGPENSAYEMAVFSDGALGDTLDISQFDQWVTDATASYDVGVTAGWQSITLTLDDINPAGTTNFCFHFVANELNYDYAFIYRLADLNPAYLEWTYVYDDPVPVKDTVLRPAIFKPSKAHFGLKGW